MNRRKFIKTGLQVGGAGLMASTLGCQGSLFDAFDSSAEEALVAEDNGSFQLFNVNLSTGAVSTIAIFPNQIFQVSLLDQNTAIAIDNTTVYSVNLNTNIYQPLLSSFTTLRGLAIENQNSVLLGGMSGYFARMNLSTLAVSTFPTLGGWPHGTALENSSSALVMDRANDDLLRVNLSTGSFSTVYNFPTTNTYVNIAIDTGRNLALILSDTPTTNQIVRVDLNTNTLLSQIGSTPDGVTQGIALENSTSVLVGNDTNAPGGGLYRVDLDTGATSRVDDGTLNGVIPRDIAVRFQ